MSKTLAKIKKELQALHEHVDMLMQTQHSGPPPEAQVMVYLRTQALALAVQAHHEYGARGDGEATILATAQRFQAFLQQGK